MVCVQKMAIFPTSFCQAIQARKRLCFRYSRTKNARLGYKKRSSKSRKIAIFPKGLTHGFGPKMTIFPTSFFQAKQASKMSFTIFMNKKNAFLGDKNKKLKKSKNCHFSKKVNAWFWSKNDHFSNFFFLGKIDQKNVFDHILEQKNAFLSSENQKIKKSKN